MKDVFDFKKIKSQVFAAPTKRETIGLMMLATVGTVAWRWRNNALEKQQLVDGVITLKDSEIEEYVESLRYSQVDNTTKAYEFFLSLSPKFGELRRSVIRTSVPSLSYGSGVLVDDNGLIAVCKHEAHSNKLNISCSPSPNKIASTTASVVLIDDKHDVVLAKIDDSSFIKQNKLTPVVRQTTNYGNLDKPADIILGYYDMLLHVVATDERKLLDKINASDHITFCEIMAAGGRAWAGMSGGATFNVNGGFSFRGMFNAKYNDIAFFTPANVIWSLVDALHGKSLEEAPNTPAACLVDRRQLLSKFLYSTP